MANKKNRIIASSVTAALVASAIAPVAGAAFTDDIPAYAKDAVDFVKENGIMNGVTATEFAAAKNITRAEVAVVIANALGLETEGKKADFADVPETHWASAEIAAVVEAGIAKGTDKGFEPSKNISRQEAAVMFANAYKELELNEKAEVSFADEDKIASWAKSQVEVLASLGIMGGKTAGFAPTDLISRGEIAVLVHRIKDESKRLPVGEEVATVESVTSVDSTTLEVVLNGKVESVSKDDFKFDNGLEVLKAEIKVAETKEVTTKTTVVLTTSEQKEGTTYKLVSYKGGKPSTEIKVEVPVVNFEVKSVSANNLKTIQVQFSEAVNEKEAESATNVKVLDGKTSIAVTRTLSEDGKTLYIVADTTFVQGKEYTLSLDGLKSVSGKELTKYNKTVTTLDTVVPVAESAKLTSPKTLELQFSEPVDFPSTPGVLTDKVQIDGINVYASNIDVTELNTTGKVVLTLGTAVSAGEHTVKVGNLKDAAGFPMVTKEFKVTLEKDEVAPEVTAVEVLSNKKIQVTFSEIVDESSVVPSNFVVKVPGSSDITISNIVKKSGTVYEMELTTALSMASIIETKLSYKGIKDNYGNTVKEAKEFNIVVKDDTTAPTIVNSEVTKANEVEVTFSKQVKNVSTNDFQLVDKDGKVVSNGISGVVGKTIDGQVSDTTYVFTLANALEISGKYTIKVVKDNDITDLSIRGNKLAETSFDITLNDKKAPSIISAKYAVESADLVIVDDTDNYDSKITITFSEEMDTTTLTNKANYILGSTPLTEISGISIVAPNSKTVVITYNKSEGSAETFSTLKVLAVKDLAGNIIKNEQLNKDLSTMSGIYNEYTSTVLLADAVNTNNVQLIANNKVKITAKENYFFASVDPNKVSIVAGSDLEAQVAAVQISEDKKSIELTLNKNLAGDAKSLEGVALKVKFATDAFVFEDGVKTNSGEANLLDRVIASVVIPESGKLEVVDGEGYPNNQIIITFDENIQIRERDQEAIKNALVLLDGEGDRLAPYCYDVKVDETNKTNLIITFHRFVADYTSSWTVSLTNNLWLKDMAGNNVNDFKYETEVITVEGPRS